MDIISEWFQYNLLTINTSKTCYVVFAAKNKKLDYNGHLHINGESIQKKDNERYLGLILDSKLTWKAHIESIKPKITSLTGALRNVVSCLPKQVRSSIYNTLVKPHLDYLVEVWGKAAKSNLNDLQIAQNKIIKVLFHYDYLTPTRILYKEPKHMNLNQIYTYKTCILIHKIIKSEVHSEITFIKNSQVQTKQLRNTDDIRLSRPRTGYGINNLMFGGAKLYNALPKATKNVTSIHLFKRALRQYVVDNIE